MSDWVDLDVLDHFLMSDAAPENCMGLSELDGFLTGLLVGPELIMPSEWQPHIWGGEDPVFENAEEAQAILGAIMRRYNEIAQNLEGQPNDLAPIYWKTKDNIMIATDWAEGFLDAIELRPDGWMPIIHDKEASILIMPILTLCGNTAGDSPLPLGAKLEAELAAEAPEIIPVCVFGIRNFWREQASRSWPIRNPPKTGRNDPCPCGSGRKYKRCCGAN